MDPRALLLPLTLPFLGCQPTARAASAPARAADPAPSPTVTVIAPPATPLPDLPPAEEQAPPTTLVDDGPTIGIAPCDEYLTLYRRCEPELSAEIQAGNRRSYRAERGWLEYSKTSPEAPALPQACEELLRELRQRCQATQVATDTH